MLLDGSIAAVMIGQYQPFCRDNLARATAAEMHYRIFQGYAVGVVYLFGRDKQAELCHGNLVLLFEVGKHPHSFVGVCRKDAGCKE